MDTMSLEEINSLMLNAKSADPRTEVLILHIHARRLEALQNTARAYHTQAARIADLEAERDELREWQQNATSLIRSQNGADEPSASMLISQAFDMRARQ